MSKNLLTDELYASAENYGIAMTLSTAFGKNINIAIGFSKSDCDKTIEEIDLSVRAFNSLKRADVYTVGEVVDAIASDRINKIKNLGAKTRNEIKTRMLELAYGSLSEFEKKQFLMTTIEKNVRGIKNV